MRPGQYVSLVGDDGMTPDVAARAFDPFFATKPIAAWAPGLACRWVCGFERQSDGQAQIYFELGQGTTN